MKQKQNQERLDYWKRRVARSKSAWEPQRAKMDKREKIYQGDREIRPLTPKDKCRETQHVWNITAENIESMVDSAVPMPKVTARKQEHEHLARIIENMLRNELDRLPMEEINDMQERTNCIQGGTGYLVEWDNSKRTYDHVGEVVVTSLHPKLLIPQDGVYTSPEDMDFIAILLPKTKESIRRQYGVDVSDESESDPEAKSAGDADSAEDMVTMYVVYYRNDQGGIGKISWVNDTLVEDLEDYQARRLRRCAKCGAVEDTESFILSRETQEGEYPEGAETGRKPRKGQCPYCGGTKWEDSTEEYEELMIPVSIGGQMVGGTEASVDEYGNVVAVATARVPYYKPNVFPVILQKNISSYGQLLGESDVDKIEDQQNTVNRMEQKIADRLLKAGTRVSLPPDTKITIDPEDGEVWRPEDIASKQFIDIYQFSGDLSYESWYLDHVYQESRFVLGITDSYQGRTDNTANSGKAKEFSAAQAAGRLESKRIMKNAAYQRLYELIFKFKLAYQDDPRPVVSVDDKGQQTYEEFNRYDFLELGEDGEYHWIDDFLFSVDDSGGLAANRSKMWQELTSQLQAGALGDPTDLDTLIDYWAAMEELHYPYAGKRKKRLMERKQEAMQAQVQAAAVQAQGAGTLPQTAQGPVMGAGG